MSTEEQDAIVGRLIRQRLECERELAAAVARLKELTSQVSNLCALISNRISPSRTGFPGLEEALATAPHLKHPTELAILFREVEDLEHKKAAFDDQLKAFGV